LVLAGAAVLLYVAPRHMPHTPLGEWARRVGLGPGGAGGRPAPHDPDAPFTLSEKLDVERYARFHSSEDSVDTLLAASPLYPGTLDVPGRNTAEFDRTRAAKVQQMLEDARTMAATAKRVQARLDKLRVFYLVALGGCDGFGLEGFIRASARRLGRRQPQRVAALAHERDAPDPARASGHARALYQHLKVVGASRLALQALADADELAVHAALLIRSLERSSAEAARSVGGELASEMAQLDGLAPSLASLRRGLLKMRFDLRQLKAADLALAQEAVRFMQAGLPELERQAGKLEARGPVDADQVAFIRDYVKVLKGHVQGLARNLGVQPGQTPDPEPPAGGCQVSAPPGRDPFRDTKRWLKPLTRPFETPEHGPPPRPWERTKMAVRGVQTMVGQSIDAAGHTIYTTTRVLYGAKEALAGNTEGNDARTVFGQINEDRERMFARAEDGTSGSRYLRDAKANMEWLEGYAGDALKKLAGDNPGTTTRALTTTAGLVAKATVSVFTGLSKGVYALADPTSTKGELAEGALEVVMACMGGSKTVLSPTKLPGASRSAVEGAGLLRQRLGLTLRRMGNALEASDLKGKFQMLRKAGFDLYADSILRSEAELALKNRIGAALTRMTKSIDGQLARMAKEGLGKMGTEALESLHGVARQEFARGLREAFKGGLGKAGLAYLDTVVGQLVDDKIKQVVRDKLDGARIDYLAGLYLGQVKGSATLRGAWRPETHETTGSIRFTVSKDLTWSGTVVGSWGKERFKGRYNGTIDPESGTLGSVRIHGSIGGLDFSGRIEGRVMRHGARGSWSASVGKSTGSGDWEATKQ
jgi:hypothetical protein